MQMSLGYLGKSEVVPEGERWSMRFSPNLSRPKVSFDGGLRHPLRFREAISALHDVVVGDLKHKPKDRAAYQQWKLDEAKREAGMREQLFRDLKVRESICAHGENDVQAVSCEQPVQHLLFQ